MSYNKRVEIAIALDYAQDQSETWEEFIDTAVVIYKSQDIMTWEQFKDMVGAHSFQDMKDPKQAK